MTGPSPPDGLAVRGGVRIPEARLRWRFSRSGGPGGQSVNTADSRVELSLDLSDPSLLPARLRTLALQRLSGRLVDGVLTVTASEHRSQLANREAARRRLTALLHDATAPPPRPRRATRPSRAARERRLAGKKARGQTKRERSRPERED